LQPLGAALLQLDLENFTRRRAPGYPARIGIMKAECASRAQDAFGSAKTTSTGPGLARPMILVRVPVALARLVPTAIHPIRITRHGCRWAFTASSVIATDYIRAAVLNRRTLHAASTNRSVTFAAWPGRISIVGFERGGHDGIA